MLPRVISTGGGIDDIMTNSDLREKKPPTSSANMAARPRRNWKPLANETAPKAPVFEDNFNLRKYEVYSTGAIINIDFNPINIGFAPITPVS